LTRRHVNPEEEGAETTIFLAERGASIFDGLQGKRLQKRQTGLEGDADAIGSQFECAWRGGRNRKTRKSEKTEGPG